jgi:hypothetical protein
MRITKLQPLLFFLLISSFTPGSAAPASYVDITGKDTSRFILKISEFENSGAYRETIIINLGPSHSTASGIETLSTIAGDKLGFDGRKFLIGGECVLVYNIDSELPHATPWNDPPLIIIRLPYRDGAIPSSGLCDMRVNHIEKTFHYNFSKAPDTFSTNGAEYPPSSFFNAETDIGKEVARRKKDASGNILAEHAITSIVMKHPTIAGMDFRIDISRDGSAVGFLLEHDKVIAERKIRIFAYRNLDGKKELAFELIIPMEEGFCVITDIKTDGHFFTGEGYCTHIGAFPYSRPLRLRCSFK